MATAVEEAQDLQAAQQELIALLLSELDLLWGQLNADTLEPWIEAATAIIEDYAIAVASLAQELYLDARDDAGLDSEFDLPPIEAPPPEQIEAALRWATSELWSGGSRDEAWERLGGAATKLVLDAGRQATAVAAVEDPQARGWVRIARPDACYFCRMLAIRAAARGWLYTSRDTALEAGPGSKRPGQRYHDHCRCVAVAVFEGQDYEAPGYVREWLKVWNASTEGKSGKKAINAFRRAVYPEIKDARNRARRESLADGANP